MEEENVSVTLDLVNTRMHVSLLTSGEWEEPIRIVDQGIRMKHPEYHIAAQVFKCPVGVPGVWNDEAKLPSAGQQSGTQGDEELVVVHLFYEQIALCRPEILAKHFRICFVATHCGLPTITSKPPPSMRSMVRRVPERGP